MGTSKRRRLVGVTLALVPLCALADLDFMRCGAELIEPGTTKLTVRQACGEPASKEVLSGGRGAPSPRVEQWVYDEGERRFPRILTFDGAQLVEIERVTE